MPIDFDSTALAAGLNAFGELCTFSTVATAPAEADFTGAGVFSNRHVEIDTDEGVQSVRQPILGVRLSALARSPGQDDQVTVAGTLYRIDDVRPDGQGGVDLVLKLVTV